MPQYEGYQDSDGNFWRECCCLYDRRKGGCDICTKNPILPLCFGCTKRIEQSAQRVQHRRDLDVAGCWIAVRVTIHMVPDCIEQAAQRFCGMGDKLLAGLSTD